MTRISGHTTEVKALRIFRLKVKSNEFRNTEADDGCRVSIDLISSAAEHLQCELSSNLNDVLPSTQSYECRTYGVA